MTDPFLTVNAQQPCDPSNSSVLLTPVSSNQTATERLHLLSDEVEELPPIPHPHTNGTTTTSTTTSSSTPKSPLSVLGARARVDETLPALPLSAAAGTTAASSDSSNATELSHLSEWAIPRWKALEGKRVALCRQRVLLERRLFESVLEHDAPEHLPEPRRVDVGGGSGANCHAPTTVQWSGSDIDEGTGLPEGYGRMVFPDGQVYEGHCRAGRRHGQGRNVWPHCRQQPQPQVYTGEWVDGRREGRGTHSWSDGRTVTGAWAAGRLHGHIFFAWPDGATYDGDAIRGRQQGRGTRTWADGRVYAGEYWAGYEHGVGMLTDVNQSSRYRGQFKRGARHGYGVQIWTNRTYDGEWSNNVVHGRGKLVWRETGACYTGQFRQGRYHGIGSYSHGGQKYVGHWCDGVKEGEGKTLWPDGRAFEGSYHQNRRHGYGRMVYADRTLYTGGWQDGARSGYGIEIAADGALRHCGMWNRDQPVVAVAVVDDDGKVSADDSRVVLKPRNAGPGDDRGGGNADDDIDTDALKRKMAHSRDRSVDDSDLDTSRAVDLHPGWYEC